MLPQLSNNILTYKDKGGGNFAFVFTESAEYSADSVLAKAYSAGRFYDQ